jgi:hypothetical protein
MILVNKRAVLAVAIGQALGRRQVSARTAAIAARAAVDVFTLAWPAREPFTAPAGWAARR